MKKSKDIGRERTADIAFEYQKKCGQRQQEYLKRLKELQKKKNAAPDGNPEAAKTNDSLT